VRRYGAIMRDIRERKRLEEQRDRLLRQLERLALADYLTGLPNRRAFFDEAQRLLSRAARHGGRLCVAILDLDHFKRVNDNYGHGAGDKLLYDIAQLCRSALRAGDIVARYGGEEFALLCTGADLGAARKACERIRRQIEQHVFAVDPQTPLKITVSIGVAEIDPHRPFDQALSAADRALYAAKRAGRNRVVAASPIEADESVAGHQSTAG
jgi:diguanylate cyclase (GGDEF)-like protein